MPAWVTEQRAKVATPTPPQRPEMPPMAEKPTAPEPPAWVEEHRKRFTAPQAPQPPAMGRAPQRMMPRPPAPAYRPWGGVPYGGWGHPYPHGYNGWQPWGGSGWGNSGWNPGPGFGYPGAGPCYSPVEAPPVPQQSTEPDGPTDGDADGVNDLSDLCPDTAAGIAVDGLGCDDAARIVLRGVNFKTDSDELTIESLTILDGVSATLSAHPQIRVTVAGHTDSDGDDSYNKDLSQRRAQSVVDYLVGHGVDAANLIAQGFGEEQPVASNDTAEGKAQNRRVELNRL
jgi:outer membrane protein OmpA-like peptidoglycan-associated protein